MIKLAFLSIDMRLPLKFGAETISSLRVCHVELQAYGATGYGETPLSAAWGWPSSTLSHAFREERMCAFCEFLAERFQMPASEDPMQWGWSYLNGTLESLRQQFNARHHLDMPYLAALIAYASFDIAVHDAFARSLHLPVYQTYNRSFLQQDLSFFFQDDDFRGKYPGDFFVKTVPSSLPVWHLVGGKDLLDNRQTPQAIQDGYPVSLEEWLSRDGLRFLKIKLTGNDAQWDYERLVAVGRLALEHGVEGLSADFNCMVRQPAYVNEVLDSLKTNEPAIYAMLLYVEQPFPSDLDRFPVDVHSCAIRKPIFLDESAHDWRRVEQGYRLGWNGVALKTCKSQTGALLSGCWAKAHGMSLMVQDLTNPRLAMMPHALLAAHFGTIKGIECNAAQFYPDASLSFEKRHPGLYERRNGCIRLNFLDAPGFGYSSDDVSEVNQEK